MQITPRCFIKTSFVLLISTTLLMSTCHLYSKGLPSTEISERLDYKATFNIVGVPVRRSGLNKVDASHMHCFRGPPCRDFLTKFDQRMYHNCYSRVRKFLGPNVTIPDNGCRFLPNQSRNAVALASFPGSGNTWLRTLIESTIGLCTGSHYCDMSLRYGGFSGENIQSGTVIMVKTHGLPTWTGDIQAKEDYPIFHSAVVIIRNPFDAFVSEWNRRISNNFSSTTVQLGTHMANAGKQYFGRHKEWNKFVSECAKRWKKMIEHWVIGGVKRRKNVLVVHYEDLKSNSGKTVSAILNFLHVNVTDNELQTKHREQENKFHRKHTEDDFEHFTRKQRRYVNRVIGETQYMLRTSGVHHGVKNVVKEYLYTPPES